MFRRVVESVAYFQYLRFRELIGVDLLSVIMAQLSVLIVPVIGGCAEKQMFWVDTLRIIAAMADKQSFGNITMRNNVGEAMRFNRLAFLGKSPVAAIIYRALPKPARICFGNALPKNFAPLGSTQGVTAFVAASYGWCRRACVKLCAAFGARLGIAGHAKKAWVKLWCSHAETYPFNLVRGTGALARFCSSLSQSLTHLPLAVIDGRWADGTPALVAKR